jgi:phosphatidylserine/phosphatidylglycerophosphate/cardiolipin synthase-like enzyme
MLEPNCDTALIRALHPIAEQAARILAFLGAYPTSLSNSDTELAARITLVSAEHVAIVRWALIENNLANQSGFSANLVASAVSLERLAANFEGIAAYLGMHKDRDSVRLVITEPGEKSALRTEIDRRHRIPPSVFQTSDAFINLARSAKRELIILAPFIDDQGAEFLLTLFSLCVEEVHRYLICRPLTEAHCGPALRRRSEAFSELKVSVYEYALPSSLPSGRETFHAKVVLADDAAFYVGSSNLMGSALERSLECGVIVSGESARHLYNVLDALRAVSRSVQIR